MQLAPKLYFGQIKDGHNVSAIRCVYPSAYDNVKEKKTSIFNVSQWLVENSNSRLTVREKFESNAL